MDRERPRILLAASFVAAFLALGAGTPSTCQSLSKQPDAVQAVSPAAAVTSIDVNCPVFQEFQAVVDPILQARCVSCHGPGGPGNALFSLVNGASTPTDFDADYNASLVQLLPDDNGALDQNPLLCKLNGECPPHSISLDPATDPNYGSLYQWISDYRTDSCCGSEGPEGTPGESTTCGQGAAPPSSGP
jgi:hypothetical protein